MAIRISFFLTLLLSVVSSAMASSGQNAAQTQEDFQMRMVRVPEAIKIDGIMDDASWEYLQPLPYLNNHWPVDTGRALLDTEVWMGFDDTYIYVAAKLHDTGNRIVQSLNRDEPNYWNSDNFNILVDPINQQTNGFLFGVNAGGAQVEATVKQGGRGALDFNWDNKWYSEVKAYQDYWIVEMAIPFKTLRYSPDARLWGVNFIRSDMSNNQYQTWTVFPNNFEGVDLGFMGGLRWEEAPPVVKSKLAVIPYAAGNLNRDHEKGEAWQPGGSIGTDAKVAISSSLNLDLTINPDFSNVNVDIQQTNLTRFSLFFPEQRNFFLENSDLFSDFGSGTVRPFFSRKIGLSGGMPVPILYGARLSGNLGDNTRVGVMNLQTRATDEIGAENVTVAAVQQRIWARSSVRALFVNKHTSPLEKGGESDFNRNIGGEFQYRSSDAKWYAETKVHMTFDKETPNSENLYYMVEGGYNSRNFWFGVHHHHVGTNFMAGTGFSPRLFNYDPARDTTVRLGYYQFNAWAGSNIFPADGPLMRHNFRGWVQHFRNSDWSFNEYNVNLVYEARFRSQEQVRVRFRNQRINLPYVTSFVSDAEPLPVGSYAFNQVFLNARTDPRKVLNAELSSTLGQFYNGHLYSIGGKLNFRTQPWGTFSLNYMANRIILPQAYGKTTLHLVGPQVNISFSNTMFWSTIVQYNTQAERVNLYSRFQWRYRPMSDLFVVWSDNYLSEDFAPTQRGLVVKLTYWLN